MSVLHRLRRAARKPPRYVVRRALDEARREAQRGLLWAALYDRGPLAARRTPPGDAERALRVTEANALAMGAFAAGREVASHPRWARLLTARAAAAKARRLEAFGDEPLEVGIPPRWNEDARSGLGWPLGFHRRLDFVNPERLSDIKVAWEVSRLRHAVALAQAAIAGDEEAQRALEHDLDDWRANNPLGWSVNWTVGMEIALRAVNLVCVDATLLSGGRPLSRRRELVSSLYQHGWFLARNLEISDLNGNHYLADAVGLVWLGRYFAGVGEGDDWWTTGLEMVRSAARDQVLADGLDHEGSLPYHALVLEMFLAARAVAPRELAAIDEPLGRMLDALASVCGPDGRVPDLGDDDGGRVLAFADVPSRDGRRVLALGAGLLDRPAPRRLEDEHVADVLWLLGVAQAEPLVADAPAEDHRPHLLDAGGIAVLGGGEDHVVMDVGPIGFRGRGGHGHVDAMSIEVVLGGRLAVRDSGTGSYTGDPALRNELRALEAHSTIVVDGIPYAQHDPVLLWAVHGDAPPEVMSCSADGEDRQEITARQRLPARAGTADWTRTIAWTPGQVTVRDVVAAPAGASVRSTLQLPPSVQAEGRRLTGPTHTYEVHAPGAAAVRIVDARWSQRYGSVASGQRAIVDVTVDDRPLRLGWTIRAR